jgi:hypothetical protein
MVAVHRWREMSPKGLRMARIAGRTLRTGVGIAAAALLVSACTKPHPYAIISVAGPIDREMLERYDTVAVGRFADAPAAPDSGRTVAALVAQKLRTWDFTVVERGTVEDAWQAEVARSPGAGLVPIALTVGKATGAKAIIVGEVLQWETEVTPDPKAAQGDETHETYVSISLRMIDVNTGAVLFGGDGHYPEATGDPPQAQAAEIVSEIVRKLAYQGGLLSLGTSGFDCDMLTRGGMKVPVVTVVYQGSPAQEAGLRPGDIVYSCNGVTGDKWQTKWQYRRSCQVQQGEVLNLEIIRGSDKLPIQVKAR